MRFFLLFIFLISCNEIETKYLYDSNDPRIINLQKDKCLREEVYSNLDKIKDANYFGNAKDYLFTKRRKEGDGSELVDEEWGIRLSSGTGLPTLTVSIRKANIVYHLALPDTNASNIVEIVKDGTCIKDNYSRSATKTNVAFTHTLRKIITPSSVAGKDPIRYDEFKRSFNMSSDYPSIFYYFRGSVVENKIENGDVKSKITYTHTLQDLDCSQSSNNKFCNLNNDELGNPLTIKNCTVVSASPTIYGLKEISTNHAEASLFTLSDDPGCELLTF